MFFILPVSVEYEARRWPVVTFTLMGLCVAMHVVSMALWFNSRELYLRWMETFWLTPADATWFTWLTSMFVHGDIFHLLGNMVYLFLFGSCVEDLIGRGRYLAFYLIAGIVASLGHIALTPGHFASELPLGGASGAISGCMGAFALLLHRARIEFKWFVFLIIRFASGEFHLPAWLVMSFWFASDVFWAVVNHQTDGLVGGGVAFGAHIGGFLLGLAAMAMMKPALRAEERAAAELERTLEQLASRPEPAAVPVASPMFFVSENGHQAGPFTLEEVWRRIEQGALTHDALYWQEGMTEWRSIREIV
jgi:membrane associated rhomboid family serine protease